MASGHQSEAELENHLIRKIQSIGYHYVEIHGRGRCQN